MRLASPKRSSSWLRPKARRNQLRVFRVHSVLAAMSILAGLSACRTTPLPASDQADPFAEPHAYARYARYISWESLRSETEKPEDECGYVEGILQLKIADGQMVDALLWEHSEAMTRCMSHRCVRLNPEDLIRALRAEGITPDKFAEVDGTLVTIDGRLSKWGGWELGVFRTIASINLIERESDEYEKWKQSWQTRGPDR